VADIATFLDLGERSSTVWVQSDWQRLGEADIRLGVVSLAEQSLGHAPPTPIELEHAIEITEDLVMPLARRYSRSQSLTVTGFAAELVAPALGDAGVHGNSMTLDELEALFNRLVAVSEGRPIRNEALPLHRNFFAAILILREFMHHLGFRTLSLRISQISLAVPNGDETT
jgi:exopolyphosphatase/pppGpp-phosphohydrolase